MMQMHSQPGRFMLAVAASLVIAAPSLTADDLPRRPPTPTPPPDSTHIEIDIPPGARQGLLHEGSHLLQAQGRFGHVESNAWRFVIDPVGEKAPVYILTVLPNSFLAEAQHVVEASEHRLVFEVTGEVMVYNARNYLLLTHLPRVVGHSASSMPPQATDPLEETPAVQQPGSRRDAESIMRDLEREAGPIQRRPGTTRSSVEEDGGRERARRAAETNLMREGSTVTMRRGRLSRDAGGGWLFVFDADASGMADPPLTLMPCLLLQRLERLYQVRGNAPLLLSGRVFVYEDRNYLLPTVLQLPRERDMLMP